MKTISPYLITKLYTWTVRRTFLRSFWLTLINDLNRLFLLIALVTGLSVLTLRLGWGLKSFVISVLVTSGFLFLQALIESYIQLKRFADLEGDYRCYSYEKPKTPEDERAGNLREIGLNGSRAHIKYVNSEVLRITVTEKRPDHVWTGDAQMESSEMGNVAWHYTSLGGTDKPWRSNGVKGVVVIRAGKSEPLRIGLHEYQNLGFGDELLEKEGRSEA